MKVWIVTGSDDYDYIRRNVIEGVYVTQEAAECKAAEIRARLRGNYDDIEVIDYDVEEAP